MKYILLAVALIANISWAVPVLEIDTGPGLMLDPRGRMIASSSGANLALCKLATRATVSTAGAAPSEDHLAIGLHCNGPGSDDCGATNAPCDPTKFQVGPRLAAGSFSYELFNNAGTVTLRGTEHFGEASGAHPPLLIRIGLKSASPATLTNTIVGQPIMHLDETNYSNSKLVLRVSGNIGSEPSQPLICPVGSGAAVSNSINFCMVNDDEGSFVCKTLGSGGISYQGNGNFKVTFPIKIAEGTENLCLGGGP